MALTEMSGRFSIVIADDDEACREAIREIVEPEGFQTYLASDGEEAVEIVQREPVHLLLCDVNMPRLTGLETLQLVRQVKEFLPCILVTGEVSDRLMRQALLAKAYTVLAKPVSKNVLIYTVVRAIIKVYQNKPPSEAENSSS
jgi:CheY-like chemotaxis protein